MAIEPFLGTRAQQGFLATVVIQSIAVLVMVAIAFAEVDDWVDLSHPGYRTVPCYLAMFGFASIFEIIVTLDALKRRNVIQLIGICIFHAGMVVFGGLQIHQTHTALVLDPGSSCEGQGYANCSGAGSLYAHVVPYYIAAPCIIAASEVVLIYFTRQLYFEYGWVVFYIVGANPKAKTMYQFYQILNVLLKFDFFVFTAVTMQLLILVLSRTGAEFALTIIAIPVVLILIFACIVAVQREIKWLMTLSLVLMCGAMAYFLYKFTRLFTPGSREAYVSTRATLAVFLIVSFIMLFATFAVGLRCFADFDKDLRGAKMGESKVDAKKRHSHAPTSPGIDQPPMGQRDSYMGGSALTPRMSIE